MGLLSFLKKKPKEEKKEGDNTNQLIEDSSKTQNTTLKPEETNSISANTENNTQSTQSVQNKDEQNNQNTQEDDSNEDFDKLVTQIITKLEDMKTGADTKLEELETKIQELNNTNKKEELDAIKEKVEKLENSLKEFSSIYEAISSQYNPLLDGFDERDKKQNLNKEEKQQETARSIDASEIQQSPEIEQKNVTEQIKEQNTEMTQSLNKQNEEQQVQEAQQTQQAQQSQEIITQTQEHTKEQIQEKVQEKAQEQIEEKVQDSTSQTQETNSDYNLKYTISTQSDLDDDNNTEQILVSRHENKNQSADRESILKKKIIEYMLKEKRIHLERLSRTVDGDKKFFLDNNKAIANLIDLVNIIKDDEQSFTKHVTEEKDDFANWIDHVLGLADIAQKLRGIKNREEYTLTLLSEI
ncbi:MAG: hypothetical protein ACLFN8_00735 [Candidatus Woesearchaeota archaeon]